MIPTAETSGRRTGSPPAPAPPTTTLGLRKAALARPTACPPGAAPSARRCTNTVACADDVRDPGRTDAHRLEDTGRDGSPIDQAARRSSGCRVDVPPGRCTLARVQCDRALRTGWVRNASRGLLRVDRGPVARGPGTSPGAPCRLPRDGGVMPGSHDTHTADPHRSTRSPLDPALKSADGRLPDGSTEAPAPNHLLVQAPT